jgi:hypothetical protein
VAVWVGVDVGGKRKGFDVAVIDDHRVLALQSHLTYKQVVDIVIEIVPTWIRWSAGLVWAGWGLLGLVGAAGHSS